MTPYKLVDLKPAEAWSLTQTQLTLSDVTGTGKTLTLLYPCKQPKKDKDGPAAKNALAAKEAKDPREDKDLQGDPAVLELLKNLKPGDMVSIKATEVGGKRALTALERYKPKTGEDEAGAYVFKILDTELYQNKRLTSVTLAKGYKMTGFLLPHEKKADGKMEPDEALLAKLNKLHDGDVIIVQSDAVGGTPFIRNFEPYTPALKGEFVKLDTAKQADGVHARVRIKTATGEEELEIPRLKGASGPTAPDKDVLTSAGKLRAGQAVDYRVHKETDGVKVWYLQPAKEAAPADGSAEKKDPKSVADAKK